MKMPSQFIKATEAYNTFEKPVPAPYIRKSFVTEGAAAAKVMVAATGFYELYINGERVTKGLLAPYISNPDRAVYYDQYEVTLHKGENVIGLLLGNGFVNNPGGYIWDFDKASYRSAPSAALTLTYQKADGKAVTIESDKTFKTAPSPIRSDDYRFGEVYDASFEIPGWNLPGFDDSAWQNVIETASPKGALCLCTADPILKETEMKPVEIIKDGDGYIYDFGVSHAGVCRLRVDGKKGQKIELRHADILKDGKLYIDNIWFAFAKWEQDREIVHKDIYIAKGEKNETYVPTFTYHGFRYVRVEGITPEQATPELLTYLVIHSDLKTRGGFSCSNETVNKLQEMTRRSDLSNFHYFPTDCPQREKNGWTADAALSAEQMLLNFNPEKSYREWLRNICRAQDERGALPGIVPTGGWGFHWGNGPAWDSVLDYLPYFTYVYRGETEMIRESAKALMAYLRYLMTRKDEDGLMHIGLGDWCHVGGIDPKAPLVLTDSVMSMDIAQKAAMMFDAVDMKEERDFASEVAEGFKAAIRGHLIDFDTMTAKGSCQSSQAMCLYYGVFTQEEEEAAFERLLQMIHEQEDHMDVGVLGGRVLFHVLSRFGESDLALKMIIRPDYPSYGNWIERGATTLWENFDPLTVESTNHHFWGDISAWFMKNLAGIQFNPTGRDITRVEIRPSFAEALDFAQGWYEAPGGKIASSWKRQGEEILLMVEIPEGIRAKGVLPKGYVFGDGLNTKDLQTGEYRVRRADV